MRGAVTVAAAQSLPHDTPQRSVLVLIAFAVLSLLVQGGTVGLLLRRITPRVDQATLDAQTEPERTRIMELVRKSTDMVPKPPQLEGDPRPEQFEAAKSYQLAVLRAQRVVLLDARDSGTFDAEVLAHALANLDASQIAIEMRGRPVD